MSHEHVDKNKLLVAITGGRGMIGRQIQKELEKRGIAFRTLGRTAPIRNDPRHLTGVTTDPELFERLIDGASVLIHLARTTHDLTDMCNFDYPALDPIMKAVLTNNLEVHFTSSEMVHDCARTYPLDVIDENFPFEPYDPYGAMKLAWERTLICYKKTHNVHYITYRYPTVVPELLSAGNDLSKYLKMGIMQETISPENENERFGGRSIIHVEQVAEVLVNNLGNSLAYGREYHVCRTKYLNNHDLAELSVKILKDNGIKTSLEWDMKGIPGKGFTTSQSFSNARAKHYLGFKDDEKNILLRNKLANALKNIFDKE